MYIFMTHAQVTERLRLSRRCRLLRQYITGNQHGGTGRFEPLDTIHVLHWGGPEPVPMSKAISGCPGRSVDLSAERVTPQPRSGLRAAHSNGGTWTMRFYNHPHRFYAGGDLHARTLYLHILDDQGQTRFEANLPANPKFFLDAIAPFRDGL